MIHAAKHSGISKKLKKGTKIVKLKSSNKTHARAK
jgi:hypothetical protein